MTRFSTTATGLALAATSASLAAAPVTFDQTSDPPGFIAEATAVVESGTGISTVAASPESAGFRFAYWDLDGARQDDPTGRGLNRVDFTITANTTATAYYFAEREDSDADGVPDWFERQFYPDLASGAASDTDGDGIGLLGEYEHDLHPRLRNEVRDGGVSRTSSATVSVIFDPGFFHYVESSEPPGFLGSQQIVASGQVVNTPSLHGDTQGFTFGYYTVGGARQADATGRALPRANVTVTADTQVVAHYFPTGEDTDGDGVPDWFEWHFLGTLANGAGADNDGDGLGLLAEYERDLHPGLANNVRKGGVSRARSELANFRREGFFRYTITSEPEGFVPEQSAVVAGGAVVTTPSLHGESDDHYFTGWSVGGVRQTSPGGLPLAQVAFAVTSDTAAVANYVAGGDDIDSDGVPDWFEWLHYGGNDEAGGSDTDGDGLTLAEEYERDLVPSIPNQTRGGGVSRAGTGLLTVILAPPEIAVASVSLDGDELTVTWPGGLGFGAVEIWMSDDLRAWGLVATVPGGVSGYAIPTGGVGRTFIRLRFLTP